MPAPPELRDAPRDIGVIEILQKVEAEHSPEADGHIGIGGEIEVDLEGVRHRAQPREEHRGHNGGKGRIRDPRHGVRQQHLFAEAEEKAHRAGGEFGDGLMPLVDLLRDGGVAHDGTGDELRKEGDVKRELERVALHRSVAAVHVDDVAQALKGEEGDADGQRYLRHRNDRQQSVEHLTEEARVLEPAQQRKPQHHGKRHAEPPRPWAVHRSRQQPAGVVDGDGEQHEQQKFRPAAGIERQRKGQQDKVPQIAAAPRHKEIQDKQARQEKDQKAGAAEYHDTLSPLENEQKKSGPFFDRTHPTSSRPLRLRPQVLR